MFLDTHIHIATAGDAAAVAALLNSAYRGESSKKGWTTEAHLIDGDVRATAETVKEVMEKKGSVILKYENDNGDIVGCVNLQKHLLKIYLGMFSVSPELQGGGIGKKLLQAADAYARQQNCKAIYMTVISVRSELIEWYKRHGYVDTGKLKSFEEDGISGHHLQQL